MKALPFLIQFGLLITDELDESVLLFEEANFDEESELFSLILATAALTNDSGIIFGLDCFDGDDSGDGEGEGDGVTDIHFTFVPKYSSLSTG